MLRRPYVCRPPVHSVKHLYLLKCWANQKNKHVLNRSNTRNLLSSNEGTYVSLEYTHASVRLPTLSNIFIFQTAWPIKAKFCSEPPYVKKQKLLCGLMSHITKMATKSIKGKTFRNRRTQWADSQETCSIGDSDA